MLHRSVCLEFICSTLVCILSEWIHRHQHWHQHQQQHSKAAAIKSCNRSSCKVLFIVSLLGSRAKVKSYLVILWHYGHASSTAREHRPWAFRQQARRWGVPTITRIGTWVIMIEWGIHTYKQSYILHLVCSVWSRNKPPAIILESRMLCSESQPSESESWAPHPLQSQTPGLDPSVSVQQIGHQGVVEHRFVLGPPWARPSLVVPVHWCRYHWRCYGGGCHCRPCLLIKYLVVKSVQVESDRLI